MTRVAAIDCGTNSIRLLIADIAGDELTDLDRDLEIVRLGQGVDRTGRLAPEAIERTRVVLASYAERIRSSGATAIRMTATSATRDASNRDDFHDMVTTTLGQPAEIISGDEEAGLSFTGAVRGLRHGSAPYLVFDIGGGSTEFVLGTTKAESARSVDIGCVRMTERHFDEDPPTPEQIAGAEADVRTAIATAAETVRLAEAHTLIGVAGTVTQLAALVLELRTYEPEAIHGAVLSTGQIEEQTERLLALPHRERAALPAMHPGRVDVIGAGALILRSIVRTTGAAGIVVSEHDILDGIAWGIA